MKISIDVNEWWEVHYHEATIDYDIRDGSSYTRWVAKIKVFMTEAEAYDFMKIFKSSAKSRYSKVRLAYWQDIQI